MSVSRSPRGLLIVFEGIDGSGKTTQAHRLVVSLRAEGTSALYCREPTTGHWGQGIRRNGEQMPLGEEFYAFIEDRREHVRDVITPGLRDGVTVVLDRYYLSNAAYQGARSGRVVEIIKRNEEFAPTPDLVFLIDVPVDVALERIRQRGKADSFEKAELLTKAAAIYQSLELPYLIRLDGTRPADDLASVVLETVLARRS